MMVGRPVIGITSGYNPIENMAYVKNGYYEGIIEGGGLPVLLPLTEQKQLMEEYLSIVDGVLLIGGPDVDARYYGESNMPYNGEIAPERDVMELCLAKECLQRDKPLMGICRGIQVLNVAAGGTLYQDLAAQINDNSLVKHAQNAPRWYATHDVLLKENSKIWQCLKTDKVGVNSFHHQAVKDPAPGFEITAKAEDGVIECIESKNHFFAVGVQWHPETMWQRNGIFLSLFAFFINQCGSKENV